MVTTGLSTVAALDVRVSVPGANLGAIQFHVTPNSPSAGQATIKAMRRNFSKLSFGAPTGLPSGVTAPTSSGQSLTSESAHTMDITHGHNASAASGALQDAAAGQTVTQALTGGVNTSTHTHTVTISSASFTSGAGSSHTHLWDNIYAHLHNFSNAATDTALAELANGTDLSGATLNLLGVDA